MSNLPPTHKRKRITGSVHGYIRVSTLKQAEYGVSLETQADKIKAFAKYKGFEVIQMVSDEGLSGKVLADRPKLDKLLNEIGLRENLVVYSLNRLARNLKETLEIYERIKQNGANLICLDMDINTNTSIGKMIFQIMASLSEFESNQLSDRVKDNMRTLSVQGKLKSRPLYGFYSPGKGISNAPHDKQQENIDIIINMYVASDRRESCSRISQRLNESKIPTYSKAVKWYPSRVRKILADNLIDRFNLNPEGYVGHPDLSSTDDSGDEEEKLEFN